jgi:DNA repair protein RadA/Sms
MPKTSTRFVCQNCGNESLKWSGQCNGCGEWNTLAETIVSRQSTTKPKRSSAISSKKIIKFSDVRGREFIRIKTGIHELDRVLGGGMVPGSVVLLAGEPGIGKSTLLTQLAIKLKENILYVCGEESPEQIKLRITRLGSAGDNLSFLPTTDVDDVIVSAGDQKLLIVDSIQTMATQDLTGMAGSVGQIRECAFRLLNYAKETGTVVFLVGHITKEGVIAGPKILEHLVDTVLYLEGDRRHEFRVLRSQKNRFGSIDEVGVFLMTGKGLEEVANPSDIFLEERQKNVPGSCVTAVMEGTRPVLVEIQALVVPSQLAVPRRVGTGVDPRRLQLLTAVLTKRARLPLGTMDVYVNVAGGLNLKEPAADLGICLAIASSFKNKAVTANTAAFGEVGLLGEIRKVSFSDKRIQEAKKLGYTKVVGPNTFKNLQDLTKRL